MDYIKRYLDVRAILKEKSCFVFGPRQTGKSALIKKEFKDHKIYNLLDKDVFRTLNHDPTLIRKELKPNDRILIIAEIQKIPDLLDEVHLMIEDFQIKFLLTGSSARTLKRKGVNMLGGRARSRHLHPFIFSELEDRFELNKACNVGLLPSIYFSSSPWEDLKAYVDDYLKEEIAAEAVVRNLGAFCRFLDVAGYCHGKIINYTNVSNDAQVHLNTVREYFRILSDTMLGFEIPAFKRSLKRKPISTSKFYFFDIGVANYLQSRKKLGPKSSEFGDAFETFIMQELVAYRSYKLIDNLHYWRSKSNFEVDFVLDEKIAIEVKAKEHISEHDLKGIRAFKEENLMKNYIVVSLQKTETKDGDIRILPWNIFLSELWSDSFN